MHLFHDFFFYHMIQNCYLLDMWEEISHDAIVKLQIVHEEFRNVDVT